MGLPSNTNALQNGFAQGYQIGRSLRFRASASAYLNRTPASATNQTTWTWSGWVKRGALTSGGSFTIFSAGSAAQPYTLISFSSDQLAFDCINSGSVVVGRRYTSAVYRDPSAWYHLVCVWDTTNSTAASRMRVYVNGVQVTAFSLSSDPALNATTQVNTTAAHYFGEYPGGGNYFDGYLAEVNFIDGQALTPSSFGVYDSNGIWQPIKYTGTYGTNGFYLPFSNTTSTTTLVADASGNGNNWTANNISLTAGTTYDSMLDSPTNSSASSNYAVLNPLTIRGATGTLTNGNLSVAASSSSSPADTSMYATLALPSNGLIYLEALYTVTAGSGNDTRIGVSTVGDTGSYVQAGSTTGYWSYDYKNGTANAQGSNTSYTAASTGQTVMFAIDVANGKIWAGANGTWYNSGNPASGTGAVVTSVPTSAIYLQTTVNGWVNRSSLDFNFGQRPFSYTPPSGYNALNTANLPQPLISNGANYMAATLWTGNGTSQSIANSQSNGGNNPLGKSFYPDFVWYKGRTTTYNHALFDTIRGTLQRLSSNLTSAETATAGSLTAFNSNGFSIGNDAGANQNTDTYVGWQWLAGAGTTSTNTSGSITSTVSVSAQSGFSVVTYTGTGANATVGHGLGVAPSMVIVKDRTAARTGYQWPVWHTSLGGGTKALFLNVTDATQTDTVYWNSTVPTSSVFSVGTWGGVNYNADNFVAYCFAAVRNYSAMGSYTGNGSSDGPMVYLGFRPRWILFKRSDSAQDWMIIDSSRDTYNVAGSALWPDLSNYENQSSVPANSSNVDFLSNGFKIRNPASGSGYNNASGGTYIYAAFAENPFQIARAR